MRLHIATNLDLWWTMPRVFTLQDFAYQYFQYLFYADSQGNASGRGNHAPTIVGFWVSQARARKPRPYHRWVLGNPGEGAETTPLLSFGFG
jgi:hypothetical protein